MRDATNGTSWRRDVKTRPDRTRQDKRGQEETGRDYATRKKAGEDTDDVLAVWTSGRTLSGLM